MSVKKRRLYWLAVATALCAVAVTLVVFLWRRDRLNDEARFQGVWVNDKLGRRLTFTGYLAVHEGFGEPREMFFRLEPRASPKQIIVYPANLPTRPQLYIPILEMEFGPPVGSAPEMEGHAIYELQGDRLRICWPLNPSSGFPKSFDPSNGVIDEYHRP